MATLTMLDRGQAPPADRGLKAITIASQAAGTPAVGAWAFYLGGRGHNGGRGSTYTNALLDTLADRGGKDAADAIRLTIEFGDRNDMLVADIERHTSDKDPGAAVEYVNGWTEALHRNGFRSMVYGSFNLAADLARRGSPQPDAVWVARFRAHQPARDMNPHQIPGVPDEAFDNAGQRAWQYAAAFADRPSGPVTPCDIERLNVDVSAIDEDVFRPRAGGALAHVGPAHVAPAHVAAESHAAPVAHDTRQRVIKPGDTLSALEASLGLARGTLFAVNKDVLDAAARAHGQPDCRNGSLIFPGVTISIP